MHAAKTHFSRLVDHSAAGEEIIIAKAGKPVAKLGPLATPENDRSDGSVPWRAERSYRPISMLRSPMP